MAGSFWSLSTQGKEAKNFFPTYGKYSDQQYRDWLGRQNQFGQQGNWLNDQAISYWNSRAQTPAPGVQDVRSMGEAILPYAGALDRRDQRFNQMLANYNSGVTSGNQVGANMRSLLDQRGGDITRTSDAIANELNTSALGQANASDAGYGGIIDTYAKAGYGLQNQLGQGYQGIRGTLGGGYDTALQALNRGRPGGEFQAATAARSFAPERANVARRLIASGVSPNSPEGIAAMSDVGERQARAMDDRLGASQDQYTQQLINLGLGKSQALAGADEAGLLTQTGIGQQMMNTLPGFQQSALNNRLNIEAARSGGVQNNLRDVRDQAGGLINQRLQLEPFQRGLQQEDWQTGANILNAKNADELLGLDLSKQQFGLGGNFLDWQQQRQDQPYNMLANFGQDATRNMFNAGNMARGFGADASQAMGQTYANEAQNAGWGTKLLTQLGMGALSAAVPGLGAGSQGGFGGFLGRMLGTGGQSGGGMLGGGGSLQAAQNIPIMRNPNVLFPGASMDTGQMAGYSPNVNMFPGGNMPQMSMNTPGTSLFPGGSMPQMSMLRPNVNMFPGGNIANPAQMPNVRFNWWS